MEKKWRLKPIIMESHMARIHKQCHTQEEKEESLEHKSSKGLISVKGENDLEELYGVGVGQKEKQEGCIKTVFDTLYQGVIHL